MLPQPMGAPQTYLTTAAATTCWSRSRSPSSSSHDGKREMRQTTTATATVRRARWSVASMKDRTARAENDAKKRSLKEEGGIASSDEDPAINTKRKQNICKSRTPCETRNLRRKMISSPSAKRSCSANLGSAGSFVKLSLEREFFLAIHATAAGWEPGAGEASSTEITGRADYIIHQRRYILDGRK